MATKEGDKEQCRFITRGSSGIEVLSLDTIVSSLNSSVKLSNSPECFTWCWSRYGKLFAYCDRQSVYVLNGQTLSKQYEEDLPHPLTREMEFSPSATYLCLWEPYIVRQGESGKPNLTVYRGSDQVVQYFQKKQDGWCLQWTDDELLCARNVTNEVHFFDGGCPGTSPTCRLQHENLSSFSIAPGQPPYHIATHIRGAKGAPSSVQLYKYPRVSGPGSVLANRSFYKADNVQMKWSSTGSSVLVLTTTDVDKTGASYYGEQNIYYLSTKGEGNLIPLDKKGPVYCIEWSPNGKEFCVVYGFMPSKASLFNTKCEMIHDFGVTHRNTALYNPQGNILCLAGFGNLRGNMEFWNMDTKKKLSETQASDSTTLAWCPNGTHLVTATTAPRLREGNGYKLWHFKSILLQEENLPPRKELWGIQWQPVSPGTYPEPDLTAPPPIVTTPIVPSNKQKAQAYVPPALRGKQRPQGTESGIPPSKHKRKRDAQKRTKQTQESTTRSHQQEDAIVTAHYLLANDGKRESTVTTSTAAADTNENDKKLKNLKKKLKQIEVLKQHKAEGKKLEANQIEKLKLEESIVKEISQLELSNS